LQVAKEYVCAFAQAILLEEEREGTPDVGASQIEGGSVPHRGAALGEASDSAGPRQNNDESDSTNSSTHNSAGVSSSRRAKKRRRAPKEVKGGATVVLSEEAPGVPSAKTPRKQPAPLVYENLTEDELESNNPTHATKLRISTKPDGERKDSTHVCTCCAT